ncbi:MAG: thiamine pyrophosphate-dependent dehydrogenase E1 component subunit alpha [Steroidobacteraceae bacterium]
MLLIRMFEDRVHEAFQKGLVFGSTHLCQGQEAVSVGAIETLRPDDTLTYTYRGHGQVLARGMSPEAAFAEIFGRDTGCSRGLGGSMHLADLSRGLLGSFAIVGAGIPVAVGAAISAQLAGRGQVAMTFFGDGATNIGAFHESMNLAAVWKLPLIFVCENNLYGEYSPILLTTPFEDLARRAVAYDMPAEIVDGNDVAEVYRTTLRAVGRARGGEGPSFIECKTYRHRGHSRSDPAKYRPPGELESWLARDPIMRCEAALAAAHFSAADLETVRREIGERLDDAFQKAAAAPWPAVRDLSGEALSGGGHG